MDYQVVGSNIDTLLLYAKGELPSDLDHELDRLKAASQEADADLATSWTFAGETFFIRAHGSGRQWRWILHCPSLHLDVGRGRFNGLIAKARLSSACLWERSADVALALLYAFLVGFLGQAFALQVAEVHLCADLAGWELALEDARAFLTRGHNRRAHLVHPSASDQNEDSDSLYEAAELEVNLHGRRCTGFEFSKGP